MRRRTKITLRGFNPNARGAGHVLGELETAVMELRGWQAAFASIENFIRITTPAQPGPDREDGFS